MHKILFKLTLKATPETYWHLWAGLRIASEGRLKCWDNSCKTILLSLQAHRNCWIGSPISFISQINMFSKVDFLEEERKKQIVDLQKVTKIAAAVIWLFLSNNWHSWISLFPLSCEKEILWLWGNPVTTACSVFLSQHLDYLAY